MKRGHKRFCGGGSEVFYKVTDPQNQYHLRKNTKACLQSARFVRAAFRFGIPTTALARGASKKRERKKKQKVQHGRDFAEEWTG